MISQLTRPRARRFGLFIAATAILLGIGAAGWAQEAPSVAVRDKLRQARAVENGQQFNAILRSIAGELPVVPTLQDKEAFSWSAVKLNVAGAGVDAIRFKSALAESADMAWVFSPPANMSSWFIISADGSPMIGFRNFATEYDVDIAGVSMAESNELKLQSLPRGEIVAGGEYILWFRLETAEPVDLHLAIRLTGQSQRRLHRPFAGISQIIAEEVGLTWPFRYKPSRFRFEPANAQAQR